MANTKKNPTDKQKESSEKPKDASTNIEQLSAIFNNLDANSIKTILNAGHAMLQERMAIAIEKVLTAHLEAFGDNSCVNQGDHALVPSLKISARGIAWEDATQFLSKTGPIMTNGGIGVEASLRALDDDVIVDVAQPVTLEIKMILSPETHVPIMDYLDEGAVSTKETLEYLQTTLAKRESETS